MGTLTSHCDDYCGLPIGNLAPGTADPRVVQMSAFGTKRICNRTRVCPLLDQSGQRWILAPEGLSAYDPKRTWGGFNDLFQTVEKAAINKIPAVTHKTR